MNLNKLILTENACYKAGRKITVKGIMVHSTGANNPWLKRYVGPDDGKLGKNQYNNHWNTYHPGGREVCVHGFIGKLADGTVATYQTLPWGHRGWHAGGSANNTHIGFEICEDDLTDGAYFAKVYKEAVELCAYLCKQYGLTEKNIIRNLVSNQEYQRNLSQKHIRRTAANFDLLQVNPVKVSRRGGINYVFNGQHTIEIVAAVSGSRDTPVWCMVYDNMDYTMEADTFANQQKYVKPLLPYDIFVANLEAGNDKQLMIKALVESMDLTIGPTKALGTICAVSSLEEIYDKHGYHVLERTLMLCIGAWEGEQNSLSANMLKGVCRLVVAYGDSMRDDMFVEKVGRYSAKDISRTAKERRAGSLGYAEAMLLAYNRKMRYPLRWGKLYNKKGNEDMGPDVETDMEPEDSEDD